MKILTGTQLKEVDKYTIDYEPISSIDLMERASAQIADWICSHIDKHALLLFVIGKGNNGGDGLAVARLLYHAGYNCEVYLPFKEEELSEECLANWERLPQNIRRTDLNEVAENAIIIDALLGTGLRGKTQAAVLSVVTKMNALRHKIISIDMPSGMVSEFGNEKQYIVKADITLTLQFPKLAMLLPESGECCGRIVVLPIGLKDDYINNAHSFYHYVTDELIKSISSKRDKFAHKGTYGHTLLICGSLGMAGAAILCTGSALRSGCGLVTLHLPQSERHAIQSSFPSAMLSLDASDYFSQLPADLSKYSSIGIGCGLGQNTQTKAVFKQLLASVNCPMVIDADALNILSSNPELRQLIPAGSVLTPHLGELKRMIGEWQNEDHKMALVCSLAQILQSVIVVKGAHTMICDSKGNCYFNSTGNSGMAKGGSGDVLTGLIAGLLSRGYDNTNAAILGVYLHGLAGDKASKKYGVESMNSRDIIDYLKI